MKYEIKKNHRISFDFCCCFCFAVTDKACALSRWNFLFIHIGQAFLFFLDHILATSIMGAIQYRIDGAIWNDHGKIANGFIDGKLSTVAILNHDNVQNCYYKLYTHYQVFKSPFFQILLTADCDTLECRLHVVCSSNGTRFFKWFFMLYGYWWNFTP